MSATATACVLTCRRQLEPGKPVSLALANDLLDPNYSVSAEIGHRHNFSPLWDMAVPFVQIGLGFKSSDSSRYVGSASTGGDWWQRNGQGRRAGRPDHPARRRQHQGVFDCRQGHAAFMQLRRQKAIRAADRARRSRCLPVSG